MPDTPQDNAKNVTDNEVFDPWPLYTRALRACLPDLPADAVVYEVDADDGGRNLACPNTILTAGRIVNGAVEGESWSKPIAKEWLRSFFRADAIERVKAEIPKEELTAATEAGWRLGYDPDGQISGVLLLHDELQRIWPAEDLRGAMADIGQPLDEQDMAAEL